MRTAKIAQILKNAGVVGFAERSALGIDDRPAPMFYRYLYDIGEGDDHDEGSSFADLDWAADLLAPAETAALKAETAARRCNRLTHSRTE